MGCAVKRTLMQRSEVRAGLTAGIAGGVSIDVFLFAVQLAGGTPAGKLAENFALIVAALLGPGAAANPAAVPIGILLHFCVAVGWALGYVYLVREQSQLLARPWISGAGFGLIVFIFMQIMLILVPQDRRPMQAAIATQLVAHVVFYGIPVALVVARLLGRSQSAEAVSAGSGRAG